ncbi:hypothetical protein M8J77_009053 [Diaphorina citri]|nr:hypothetical protein M8J77_009053 [Diaphorina citri]
MMKGWLRTDGGPTLYNNPNRTPVTGDVQAIFVYLVFFTLFLAFLIIFPGVRKERFTTFMSVTLSLFVGNVILVTKCGSGWHVGKTEIVSTYRAYSRELINAELGGYIGLNHINITLRVLPTDNSTEVEDIDFNERFSWIGSYEMGESYREGLVRGLPFPILTVAEYFSLGQEGFAWGGQYRAAGYYAGILLWAAFAAWLLMNLLLVVVPRYGAYAMTCTGILMVLSATVYHCMLPKVPLMIRFESNKVLSFHFGWCFYLVIAAGLLCFLVGVSIAAVDLIYPHKFSTILEVDYDTPFDRHIIIEDSSTSKKRSKGLEDPPGLGKRLLRRLSSKKDEKEEASSSEPMRLHGLDNRAFDQEPPKSPWRYPFQRPAIQGTAFQRTESQDSTSKPRTPLPYTRGEMGQDRHLTDDMKNCWTI